MIEDNLILNAGDQPTGSETPLPPGGDPLDTGTPTEPTDPPTDPNPTPPPSPPDDGRAGDQPTGS